jgi:hypothetical protein
LPITHTNKKRERDEKRTRLQCGYESSAHTCTVIAAATVPRHLASHIGFFEYGKSCNVKNELKKNELLIQNKGSMSRGAKSNMKAPLMWIDACHASNHMPRYT